MGEVSGQEVGLRLRLGWWHCWQREEVERLFQAAGNAVGAMPRGSRRLCAQTGSSRVQCGCGTEKLAGGGTAAAAGMGAVTVWGSGAGDVEEAAWTLEDGSERKHGSWKSMSWHMCGSIWQVAEEV